MPVGAVTIVPGGRCSVMCVSTSRGAPSSIGDATAPAAGFAGGSGKPSWGSSAGMRTGFFDQSTNLGILIS